MVNVPTSCNLLEDVKTLMAKNYIYDEHLQHIQLKANVLCSAINTNPLNPSE